MTSSGTTEKPAVTVDGFLGGRITLVQPAKGHRAGLDAALLQALVPGSATGDGIDLGSGVGTVALCVAARSGLAMTGVERDPELVACARSALALSGNAAFADRVSFVETDVTALGEHSAPLLPTHSADWVLMNPPWDKHGEVRESLDSHRRAAHVGDADLLVTWIRAAADLLKPGGFVGLVHRAAALPEVLDAFGHRFGDTRVLPVHPAENAAAKRVLVRATLGRRGGFQLLPPLILHTADGAWTPRADAILRGEAELAL